jgi:ABC-type transport system involved in multi-copper enzyme maturation permease subunit
MTYKNFTTVASIVAFVFGLGFILMPAQLTGYYNVTLNEGGIFIGQLFGAALLGFGVLNWFGRHFSDEQAQQGLANANIAGDGIGFIFALLAQLNGNAGVNALGWSTVVIYLLLALGFAYLRFFAK